MNRNHWKIVMLATVITLALTFNLYGQQQAPPPGFKNLKILPKDITRQQLMGTMQAFNRSLGVTCNHCHADDKSSDEKPEKDVARAMMKMMGGIKQNAAEYLPGDRAAKVNCWTCHRGNAKIELPPPPPPPPAPAPKPPQ